MKTASMLCYHSRAPETRPRGRIRRQMLARSLREAQENVEALRLYAKSMARLLEQCAAENAAGGAPGLDFVRADVDRLADAARARLALLHRELESSQ